MTAQLSSFADVWRDVLSLDDEALAQQITDDRIDILVDLTMHMCDGRPLLFARRPAPVQVSWLAYPGMTGSRAIGYRFTDPWLDPVDSTSDDRYSERSIRLPDTFWCYSPLVTVSSTETLPADDNGYITFACLEQPWKADEADLGVMGQSARQRSRLAHDFAGVEGPCVSRTQFDVRGARDRSGAHRVRCLSAAR